MEKFTIEEIRNYLKSQDSFGDAMYYLSSEKIRQANSLSQSRGDLLQDIIGDAESGYTPLELLPHWEKYLDVEWSSNGIDSKEGEIVLRYYPQGNPFHSSAGGDSIATHELTFKNCQLHSVEPIEE